MSISVVKDNHVVNDTELLSEVFNAVTSAIVVVDKKGTIVKVNACATEMFGADMVNEKWFKIVKNYFAPKADDGHEVSLKDGRKLLVSTKPLSVGQLVVLTDVTVTRRLQERVGHMERLSSLGKMAASLAHQIRTPLSAAMLYAANLTNKGLSELAKQNFIHKLMDRLTDLENQVRDILLFAKSSENIVDKLEVEDLVSAIESGTDGILTRNNVSMDVRMVDEELVIIANKTALASAISNLVSNAVEANAKKLILDVQRHNTNVVIKVADNGKGMSQEVVQKIFEPFYTTKSNGTGLGLAVVNSVIKAHQGNIGLVSEVGKGTCFTITIPLCKDIVSRAIEKSSVEKQKAA